MKPLTVQIYNIGPQAPVEEEQHSQDMKDLQDSQMSEKVFSFSQQEFPAPIVFLTVKPSSSSSSPTTVLSCVCQNGSMDPLMLVFSTCSTVHHICWFYSKENPGSAAVVDAGGLGELNRLARELLELLQNAVRTR